MIPKCIGGVLDHVRHLVTLLPVGSAAPDHTVPYGTVLSGDAFPGTSCLATISLSLRDKSHSPIEGLALVSAYGLGLVVDGKLVLSCLC